MFPRLLFILIMISYTCTGFAQLRRFSYSQMKMASPFTIVLYANDVIQADSLTQQCFHIVDSLAAIFTDYDETSELNSVCRAGGKGSWVVVSDPLYEILSISKEAFEKSDGRFDITLGPLTQLWRKARKEKIFPSDSTVKEKLALTGFTKIHLSTALPSVLFDHPGMQLDLGGIAQGYIAQKVAQHLRHNNITNALIDVSGDIVAIGAPPGTAGWKIGINAPESRDSLLPKHLVITNKSVTTSGDVYQFMEHNRKRYSHIINPRTGYGITTRRNVTVMANDGITADWLTKACSLLPVRRAKKLARQLDAELLIVEIRKNKLRTHSTKNFKS